MPSIRDLVSRGRPFTGRVLQTALLAAGRPPVGGGKTLAITREAEAVVRSTGRTPIPRLPVLSLQIQPNPTVILVDANGNPARWRYAWLEVHEISPDVFQAVAGGKTSGDPGRELAFNRAEQMNTSSTVARGIEVSQPEITVQVLPIPAGQTIQAVEYRHTGGGFGYWFEAYNGLHVECVETAGAAGHYTPPSALRRFLGRSRPDGKWPAGGWPAYTSKPG